MAIDIYNPVFGLALLAIAFGVAAIVSKCVPFYRTITSPINSRYRTLDGFRGFLGLSVFVHHCSIYYKHEQNNTWQVPASSFYAFLGPGAVAFFFMITGFLFWSKGLSAPKSIDYPRLMPGRLRRLMPMYLSSYAVILVLVFVATHGKLTEPLARVLGEIGWGSLGGLFNMPCVNGYAPGYFNAGVVWSLRYEWLFYLSLPVLIRLLVDSKRLYLFSAIYVCAELLPMTPGWLHDQLPFVGSFLAGMVSAQLLKDHPQLLIPQSPAFRALATALLIGVAFSFLKLPSLAINLGMFPIFLAVVYGYSFFGVFSSRAAVLLGHISYSVYLTHGILLHLSFWVANHFVPLHSIQPVYYWLLCSPIVALVVASSSITFRFIEWPFIKGKPKDPDRSVSIVRQAQTAKAEVLLSAR